MVFSKLCFFMSFPYSRANHNLFWWPCQAYLLCLTFLNPTLFPTTPDTDCPHHHALSLVFLPCSQFLLWLLFPQSLYPNCCLCKVCLLSQLCPNTNYSSGLAKCLFFHKTFWDCSRSHWPLLFLNTHSCLWNILTFYCSTNVTRGGIPVAQTACEHFQVRSQIFCFFESLIVSSVVLDTK